MKTLKSFGFVPPKGTNKIPISSLSKEKIKKLANLRVIKKTLVYVIGLAPEIAQEDVLKSVEYFGQYGDLTKVVVNTNNVYNATKGGPSYSAYLTFSHPRESAIAILVSAVTNPGPRLLTSTICSTGCSEPRLAPQSSASSS